MNLLSKLEQNHIKELEEKRKKEFPPMRIGDTVRIGFQIQEGDKMRSQPFEGTLMKIHGSGLTKTFTLRKIVGGEGVERTFPLNSSRLVSLEITRYGKARRAKLYYLRERVGKATKIKERNVIVEQSQEKAEKKKKKAEDAAAAAAAPKAEKKKEKISKNKAKREGKSKKA